MKDTTLTDRMAEENEGSKNSSEEGETPMEIEQEDAPRADALITDNEGGIRVDDEIYIPPPVKTISIVDTSGPRLMISQIVNENFKSYGGTQVIGPFHKCFSAIVGPNGSGKSNVIDSMLFVFGYRASKIRSKKISVLIHNSSEKQNINSCTVSVHFQQIVDKPGMEYDVVPNSEFVISRTAFKDNSSYYELNKRKVQFKEIGKLLRSYGVDLDHNRFLILQGEVEQIAMMKPKAQTENETGMLEYLEDIIGTFRYKEPLEKLSEKVEHLSEYRTEKLNRLRIVEKEKAALEEPMQEAVQYLKMENTVTKLEHQLYCHKRFETTKEIEQHESKMNELNEDLSKLADKMKEVQNDKEQKSRIIAEKNKKWDNLQKKKDEVVARFDKIRKQDESLYAELVETNKRRKANTATLKSEKTKLEELSRVPEKSVKDIEECKEMIVKHEKNKEKEEAILETLMVDVRKKTEPLVNERSKLEKQLISLRKDVDQAQASFNIAQSELELYTSIESSEKEKLEKLKNSLKSTAESLNEKKEQLQRLENDIPAAEVELEKAQKELKTVEDKEMKLTSELRKMRISYEEQRSAMQASTSRNKVLDSLMREKREGRIPGIFGRLGDLGAIDAKYDVAISTACGPLDNIVVDTVDTAQKCISFLRQQDIGRATLIPLEKQQHLLPRCTQRIKTPENVSRLFDLVRVEDERILPAFYYGLQDTLVANDLEQATRIAYGQQRFRVVTSKGELIELSGTMSGGGRSAMRGRMGQKLARNELSSVDVEKLQSDLNETSEQCNRLRVRSQFLENQIQTLSVSLRNMRMNRGRLEIEVKALEEQKPSLLSQIKIQEKKAKDSVSDPEKVQQLRRAMEAAKKSADKVKENSNTLEREVKCINAKIEELSGVKVKDQQKKIGDLNKSIDTMKAEICRLQVAIKTAERNVKKLEQRIESLENDVHNSEQRLRDIEKEKQELEKQGKEYLLELEELKEALAERDEATLSLKEELNALQTTENKMKAIKIDLDQKLKERRSAVKELTQRVPDFTRKISALKLQAIPGENQEELKELTEEEFREIDEKALLNNLQKAKKRMPAEIPNMHLIHEYREKDELYLKRAAELEKITTERNRIRDIYETARRRRIEEFLAGFSVITDKLKEMYQMITLGGDAELELVDSLDPFSEGVAFSVRPPKKSWKNICNLSGGEKTLSSLALVFALHHYKPTPLYFMDEIDAALDFKNVSIVGNYIKERTKNAQFIVISLRSNMFELADFLVGIYKTYNCTKSVTVDLKKYYEKNGIAPPTQITSKTMYSSQMQKFSMHSQQNKHGSTTQSTNHVQTTDESQDNGNNSLRLPELGLCATPEKSFPQNDSVEDSASLSDKDISKRPTRKKRKL